MNVSGLGEKAALLFEDQLDPWVAASVDFDIHNIYINLYEF